jgi:hypothetical protein
MQSEPRELNATPTVCTGLLPVFVDDSNKFERTKVSQD